MIDFLFLILCLYLGNVNKIINLLFIRFVGVKAKFLVLGCHRSGIRFLGSIRGVIASLGWFWGFRFGSLFRISMESRMVLEGKSNS